MLPVAADHRSGSAEYRVQSAVYIMCVVMASSISPAKAKSPG